MNTCNRINYRWYLVSPYIYMNTRIHKKLREYALQDGGGPAVFPALSDTKCTVEGMWKNSKDWSVEAQEEMKRFDGNSICHMPRSMTSGVLFLCVKWLRMND